MGAPDESERPSTKVMQITNLSNVATREQIYQMMSYLGRVEDLKVTTVFDAKNVSFFVSHRIRKSRSAQVQVSFCKLVSDNRTVIPGNSAVNGLYNKTTLHEKFSKRSIW